MCVHVLYICLIWCRYTLICVSASKTIEAVCAFARVCVLWHTFWCVMWRSMTVFPWSIAAYNDSCRQASAFLKQNSVYVAFWLWMSMFFWSFWRTKAVFFSLKIHNFCWYVVVFCILVLKIDHSKGRVGNLEFMRKIKIKILGGQGVGDG